MTESRSRPKSVWIRLLTLMVLLVHSTDCSRILMVTLGGTKSHKIPFLELGRGLISRGHSVTLMSAFPPGDSPLPQRPSTDTVNIRRLTLSSDHPSLSYGNTSFTNASVTSTFQLPPATMLWSSKSAQGFLSAPSPPSTEPGGHIEEVAPSSFVQFVREFTDWDLLGRRLEGKSTFQVLEALQYAVESCRVFLTAPETRRIIQDHSVSYDLLIADGAFPDCAIGFAHRFRVPFMFINTVGFHVRAMSAAGSPTLYAVTPFFSEPYTERMSFFERAMNSALYIASTMSHKIVVEFALQRIVREAFGPDVPNIEDHEANVSFVLQNGHSSVSYARSYLPLVAEIACIHCKPAKPLPQDLEEFVSGGPEGFIYFSMGSSVRASNMPPQLMRLFVETFARLSPIRVLWKWEESDIADIPPNVKLGRWLPQQDLLGHPRIRGFVTHGGLLSMFETVFHGVPVVTMPVFCDHDSNAAKAELDGYAIKLELRELTVESLSEAIRKIIFEPRFRENVHRRSILLRDQPESPLERAIYWTEYVVRHGGATHLQSPAKDLSAIQLHGVDVAAFFVVIAVILIALPVLVFRLILPRLYALVSRRMKIFRQFNCPVKQKVH